MMNQSSGDPIDKTGVAYGDGMMSDYMNDEASAATHNTDTLSASAAQRKRQEERDQRLQEIERTFQRVVEESHLKEESIYNNVFREDGEVHNEANIKEMETQIKGKQTVLNRFANKLSIKKDDKVYPFQVQSPTAVGDFDDLPGFLPPDDFGVENEVKKDAGSGLDGNRKQRAHTTSTIVGKYRWLVISILLVCFVLTVVITMLDFGGETIPNDIPKETWGNLKDVRNNLVGQGVQKEPLYEYDSPQFQALQQLAEEVTLGELSIAKNQEDVKPGSTDREIIERYSLLTLYYSTTTPTEKWTNQVNWQRNDKSICDEWYNVECKEIQEDIKSSVYNKTQVVTKLVLKDNGLVGTIPGELAHLSSLEILHLESNNLEGNVPASLGELKELQSLKLSFNKLTGKFPDEICSLNTNALLDEIEVSCANLECKCCECL